MQAIVHQLGGRLGHLLLLAVFCAFALLYAWDAYRAQPEVENLLLIGPAAAIVVVIGAVQAGREFASPRKREKTEADLLPPLPHTESFRERYGTPIAALGLGAYVIALPLIGFDIATALFVAGNMVMQGERRPAVIAAFALLVSTLPIIALQHLITSPVPTMVLP